MIPALVQSGIGELVAIASRSADKAVSTAAPYGAAPVVGYDRLLARTDIHAVYIPLPTGLHEEWCTQALQAGKHILVEKSFATNAASADLMLSIARQNKLLVMENFQFQTHSQWHRFRSFMTSGEIGDVRLVRSTFGFPPLPKDNFRWVAALGGGTRLDAGAYLAQLSLLLLGPSLEVRGASQEFDPSSGVDIYGAAQLCNTAGQIAQVAYGFDYFYQCRAELLGTKGKVSLARVFTAPPDFRPVLCIETPAGIREEALPADDHYVNMWRRFAQAVTTGHYDEHWNAVKRQAHLLEKIHLAAQKHQNRK